MCLKMADLGYQMNLTANWSSRFAAAVLLIVLNTPISLISTAPTGNLPVGSYCAYVSANGFGMEKSGWFSTLNASNRNCRFRRSVIAVVFMALKSMLTYRGPRRTLRGAVPNASRSVGKANAETFHQFKNVLGPRLGLPTRSQ